MAAVPMSKALALHITENAEESFKSRRTRLYDNAKAELAKDVIARTILFKGRQSGFHGSYATNGTAWSEEDSQLIEASLLRNKRFLVRHLTEFDIGIDASVDVPTSETEFESVTVRFHHEIAATSKVYWPAHAVSYTGTRNDRCMLYMGVNRSGNTWLGVSSVSANETAGTEFIPLIDWVKQIAAVEYERRLFMLQLEELIKSVNSLRQFLTAWPQGEHLVPEDALQRMNEKTRKKNKIVDDLLPEDAKRKMSTSVLMNRVTKQ